MAANGGSTPSQYRKAVELPLSMDRTKSVLVDVESIDIISAWEMNFNLANIQKAIHRLGKKQGVDDVYDYNKILFFTLREMLDKKHISLQEFWQKLDALGLGG